MPKTKAQHNRDNQRKRRLKIKQMIHEAKDVPCADCGVRYPFYVMQLHHKDASEKSFGISQFRREGNTKFSALEQELLKCVALCANCHAEREWGHLKSSDVTGTLSVMVEEPSA